MGRIFYDLQEWDDYYNNSICAIGNFDGVHIGHQELIKNCNAYARSSGLHSGVITFLPHPTLFFKKSDNDRFYLQTQEDKFHKIFSLGIDFIFVLNFNEHIATLTPHEFLNKYIVDGLHAKRIISGQNFRFGAKRAGDTTSLNTFASESNFAYTQINTLKWHNYTISSTFIRSLLKSGRVLMVSRLLGEYYSLRCNIASEITQNHGFYQLSLTINSCSVTLPMQGTYFVRLNHNIYAGCDVRSEPSTLLITFDMNTSLETISEFKSNIHLEFISLIRVRVSDKKIAKELLEFDNRNITYLKNNLHLFDEVY
jgi:riboflavin kinase / FMN adenylyltransferase